MAAKKPTNGDVATEQTESPTPARLKHPGEVTAAELAKEVAASPSKAMNPNVRGHEPPAADPTRTGKGKGSKGKRRRKRSRASKKTTATTSTKPATDDDSDKRRVQRPYPQRHLEDALRIPQKIKEKNGKPMATEEVAKLCGYSHVRSAGFFYLANAARDYDLTKGTWSTETIEISDLGRKIVYAGDPASEREAKIEAFFKVDIFKKMFGHYGGSKLPAEEKYLRNKLENDFGLHRDLHDEFLKLYIANCKYLGIEQGLADGDRRFARETPEGADVRVVGEAKGKFDRTAFVIMPFSEKGQNPRPTKFFEEVLSSLITPAANQAGFAVETAQRHGSEVIQSTIINQLLEVDLVICDLTDHNPNVLFELGIRIAKELPVALIRAEGTGPIFDVDHLLRVQGYSPNLWTTTIQNDLSKLAEHFKATWDNRSVNAPYMTILTAKHPATRV